MTPAAKAKVVREGTKTYIAGLEKIEWGGASLYQNSNIAALTFAQQAAGDDADYMDLMGKSGLAFRVQFQLPDGCPSSPHACCGFDSWKQALWASGRAVETFDTREGNPATIEKARAAVVASIDRGWPVIYASEETGLAVGYVDAGRQLLIRPYSPKAQGYETTDKWPWQIIVLSPKKAPPPRKDVLVNSLRLGVHLWQTPSFGKYASGQAAYDAWAKLLDDDKRFQSPDPKALWGICHANGFTYGCLENSRQFAVKYLRSIQADFSPPAAEHLRQAAALYDKSHEAIGRPGQGIDPWGLFPWDLKGGVAWTPGMRHAQAAVLREMAGFDKQAVAELQLALKAEGVTEDLPPVPAAAQETPGKAAPDYSKLALKGDENAKDSFSLTVQAVARVYGIDVDYETVYALSGSGFAPGIHPPEDCRQLQRMHDRGQGLDIVAARLGLVLRPLEFADKSKPWTEIREALARGDVVLTDRGWRDALYTFWGVILDAPANGPVNDIRGATLTGRTDHRLDHVGRCWAVTLGKPTMTPEQADIAMLQRAVARIRGDKAPFLPGNVVYGLKAMDLWIADMKKPSFQPGDPASSLGNAACCALYTSEGARDVCSYLRRRLATFPEGSRPHIAAAADQYDLIWRTLKPFAVPTGGYAGVIGDQARQKDHADKVLLPCKEALAKAADHLEKALTALNTVEH